MSCKVRAGGSTPAGLLYDWKMGVDTECAVRQMTGRRFRVEFPRNATRPAVPRRVDNREKLRDADLRL